MKKQQSVGGSGLASASDDTFLTRQEAADFLGRSKSWLANGVTYNIENVPKPDRKDGRSTLYKLSSLRAWQEANSAYVPPSTGVRGAPSKPGKPYAAAPESMDDEREDTQSIMIAGLESLLDNLKAHRERKGGKS